MNIEYGLGAIKGVADTFIKHVCSKRDNLNFKDIELEIFKPEVKDYFTTLQHI